MLLEKRLSWEAARHQCGLEGVAVGGVGDLATPTDMEAFRTFIDNIQIGNKGISKLIHLFTVGGVGDLWPEPSSITSR